MRMSGCSEAWPALQAWTQASGIKGLLDCFGDPSGALPWPLQPGWPPDLTTWPIWQTFCSGSLTQPINCKPELLRNSESTVKKVIALLNMISI